MMLSYRVSTLNGMRHAVRGLDATHLVSIADPGSPLPSPPGRIRGNLLVLRMHDLDRPDDGTRPGNPALHHVHSLLDFARGLPADARVVFHCVSGRRRSAAAALICDLALRIDAGQDPTRDLANRAWDELLRKRKSADPNRALLRLADGPLGFGGSLHAAAQGRGRVITLT